MAFWHEIDINEPLRQNRWYILFGDEKKYFQYSLKEFQKPEYSISFTEHRLLTQTFKLPGLLKWKPINIKFVSSVTEKQTMDFSFETILRKYGYKPPQDYSYSDGADASFEEPVYNQKQLDEIKRQFKDANSQEARALIEQLAAKKVAIKYKKGKQATLQGSYHQEISNHEFKSTTDRDPDTSFNYFQQKITLIQVNSEGKDLEKWELYNPFFSSVKYGNLTYDNDNFVEISATIEYDWALQLDSFLDDAALLQARRDKAQDIRSKQQTEIDGAAAEDGAINKAKKKEEERIAAEETKKADEAKTAAERKLGEETAKLRALEDQARADDKRLQQLKASEDRLRQIERDGTEAQKQVARDRLYELKTLENKQKELNEQIKQQAKITSDQEVEKARREAETAKQEREKAQREADAAKAAEELKLKGERDRAEAERIANEKEQEKKKIEEEIAAAKVDDSKPPQQKLDEAKAKAKEEADKAGWIFSNENKKSDAEREKKREQKSKEIQTERAKKEKQQAAIEVAESRRSNAESERKNAESLRLRAEAEQKKADLELKREGITPQEKEAATKKAERAKRDAEAAKRAEDAAAQRVTDAQKAKTEAEKAKTEAESNLKSLQTELDAIK